MLASSSFCVSRPRDATRRMSATELVCAAPSQQRLRRSSDSVAAPSQQRCAHHEQSTGQSKIIEQPLGKIYCQKQGGTIIIASDKPKPCYFSIGFLYSASAVSLRVITVIRKKAI